jgi:hypothetical protein
VYVQSVEVAEKLTGREGWMTQAVFMNRATSQDTKSPSSVSLVSPFGRFLRETPRRGTASGVTPHERRFRAPSG